MAVAILVGLPREQVKRVKHAVEHGAPVIANWSIDYVPARKNAPEIHTGDIDQVFEMARKSDEAHVIGVSKQDKTAKQQASREIKPYFRFRWMKNELLTLIGQNTADFVTQLNLVLEEEDQWRREIKPAAVSSALLLPEPCFKCDHPHSNIWELAEQFGDPTTIPSVAKAIETFTSHYMKSSPSGGRKWTDTSDRVYDHGGERHATAPFPRNWKYSYSIPDGFHFDVTNRSGREFVFRDANAKAHSVATGKHINIDPHGYPRADNTA